MHLHLNRIQQCTLTPEPTASPSPISLGTVSGASWLSPFPPPLLTALPHPVLKLLTNYRSSVTPPLLVQTPPVPHPCLLVHVIHPCLCLVLCSFWFILLPYLCSLFQGIFLLITSIFCPCLVYNPFPTYLLFRLSHPCPLTDPMKVW